MIRAVSKGADDFGHQEITWSIMILATCTYRAGESAAPRPDLVMVKQES